jgi:hypothetical protein
MQEQPWTNIDMIDDEQIYTYNNSYLVLARRKYYILNNAHTTHGGFPYFITKQMESTLRRN